MNKIYFTLIFSFISLICFGQKGTYDALNSFLSTSFFEEFKVLRDKSESAVKDFKLLQELENYSEEDMAGVITAYNLSAKRFNRVLLNIKKDMLDKETKRYIAHSPEGYAKQVEADFYRAKEFYANTFQEEVTTLTNGKVTGAAFLVFVPKVIGFIEQAVNTYKNIRKKLNKVSEGMIDKYLVEPNRFKLWDEI